MTRAARALAEMNTFGQRSYRVETRREPDFAAAHAAWSQARFQDVFQRFEPDRDKVIDDTLRLSERAVELDPYDPSGHFALGRAHWLAGRPREGLRWMDSSIELNPNFALGFYSRGFLNLHSGADTPSEGDVAESLRLSPVDPLAYGMHATYALTMLQKGDLTAARDWSERSASAVNAHHHVILLAAAISELASDRSSAVYWRDRALAKRPDANIAGLLEALPMGGGELADSACDALRRINVN